MDDFSPSTPVPAPDGGAIEPTKAPAPVTHPVGVTRRRRVIETGILGALIVSGFAGATLFGPLSVLAATPSAAPSQLTQSGQPTGPGDHGGPAGFMGGRNEAVSDASVAAAAIGISETDLTTALQGGQSLADVAKAHNVDVQKVVDALVADKNSELAAAVTAGTLTQAQADAEKANMTRQVTDQVNGTFSGGPAGPHGPGGPGGPGGHDGPGGRDGQAPAGAPSGSTPSTGSTGTTS